MPNADEASSFEGVFQDVSCNWLPRDFQAKENNTVFRARSGAEDSSSSTRETSEEDN